MSNTPERSVLRSCYKDLVKEITDPNALAVDLYSQGVLTASERDQVQARRTVSKVGAANYYISVWAHAHFGTESWCGQSRTNRTVCAGPEVTQATLTTSQRNEHLLRFLEARVASDREAFDKLVSILESEEAYSGLARKLKEKLKELNPPASGSWCSIN
ncbi:hypothetical protein EMCRGX_G004633 [Ephydatia muelleri]